ncbi:MAG TPA: TIGR02186 family protein, partial [Xanthobacteraceae bacterium]|nr:TIGR02186 family protein [Xanthobacteraceae bacterium]
MRRLLAVSLVLFAAVAGATSAGAERLVSSLSTHRVLVTSSFIGQDIVLFGTVERDAATTPRRGGYDIVVTVTGPRETLVTRRKERMVGIWVNVESRTFVNVPSYLAVLTTKPVEAIAAPDALRRLQVGLENTLLPQQIGVDVADVVRDDPFRSAFLRLKSERGLYREEPNAVTFLTANLFRATIPLPADVPVGNYDVDVKLFADGAMIARTTSALEIIKVGFEQFVVTAARD